MRRIWQKDKRRAETHEATWSRDCLVCRHAVQLDACDLVYPRICAPRLQRVQNGADLLLGFAALGVCVHDIVCYRGTAVDDPAPKNCDAHGSCIRSAVGHAGPGAGPQTMPDKTRQSVRLLFAWTHSWSAFDAVCRGPSEHAVCVAVGAARVPKTVPQL